MHVSVCVSVSAGGGGGCLVVRERVLTLVAFIFIPDVFLNTFLIAFSSAKSPTMVEVAWAFM